MLTLLATARAAPTCEIISWEDLDFGTAYGSLDSQELQTYATLTIRCSDASNTYTSGRLCINIGDGVDGVTYWNPRRMTRGNSVVAFQIYQDPSFTTGWGTVYNNTAGPAWTGTITIPPSAGGESQSAAITVGVYGRIPAGQSPVALGVHQNHFSVDHTSVMAAWASGTVAPADCSRNHVARGVFTARVNLAPGCTVDASGANPIRVGNPEGVTIDETQLSGEGELVVECGAGASYNIGLSPSNGDSQGAGVMTSGREGDRGIPYQLRSQPGPNGAIWGNAVTAQDPGNGVGNKEATGKPEHIPVYVTVPNTNGARPGDYRDTVTVTVHY